MSDISDDILTKEGNLEKEHSTLTLLSYISPGFGFRFAVMMIFTRMLFFYEVEILLPIVLMTLATAIYTGWDMINDPLIGHRSDRNTRLTRRWGRRFPWMMISFVPLCVTMVLIYLPPDPQVSGVWATFAWFLIILLLYDTFEDAYLVPYFALRVAKFRSVKERRKLSTLTEFITTIGLLLAFIVPPFIVEYGNPASYIPLIILGTITTLISIVLGIPGTWEDGELRENYFLDVKEQEPFFSSFFLLVKNAFKNRNFVAFFISMLSMAIFNLLFVSSIPYWVYYIMQADPTLELLIYIPYFAAILAPIPLTYYLTKKFGHLKMFIISGFGLYFVLLAMIPMITNLVAVLIFTALLGFLIGLSNVAVGVTLLDFYDEVAVRNEERQEGAYYGIFGFLTRFTFFLQFLLFWLVHTLTGFDPEASVQTPFAQWGIVIIMLLIPGVIGLIAVSFFAKIYDLKPEKMEEVRAQLRELGI